MSWVLFFDGDCGFCTASVRWVAQHDKRKQVWFAPLQGELAGQLGLGAYAAAAGSMVVLREADQQLFTYGDAWIELARALGGPWRYLAVLLRIVPKFLRDALYRVLARNRHLLPGRNAACALPDPEWRQRLRD